MRNRKSLYNVLPRIAMAAIASAVTTTCLANDSARNFGEVTLSPGISLVCTSDPCTVFFQMPPGSSGTHSILQNGMVKAGEVTGDQPVSLGQYSNQSVVFHVDGSDLLPAYLTVIGGP